LLNYTNVARETGVSAKVVRSYFEILEDTLLGARLAPWKRARDRRLIQTEKFFLFDVGIANHLARRTPVLGSADFGKSFEHWVLMEILNYRRYREPDLDVCFWRTAHGHEVDFVLGDMEVAIEVKGRERVHTGDFGGLLALRQERKVGRSVVVSLERARRTVEGVDVLPWKAFLEELWGAGLRAR
jgi:predicted AAA+ superfamily ATPase